MKYINKILSLFVIALIATSCDPDAESYTLGELEDGNKVSALRAITPKQWKLSRE